MKYSDVFGKKSSAILLGTTYFGDGISEETAFALMDKFREEGGRHIDTARMYADGRAEEIVGRWVKSRNATEMLVSSKGGYPYADTPDIMRVSEKEVRSDLEKSLKALGTERIEFYWLHRDDPTIPVENIIEMMNRFVREGKIGKFGASNWKSERLAEAQTYAKENNLLPFSASQIRFNPAVIQDDTLGLVDMNKEEFAFYEESRIPVVAFSSQAKGFFSKMAQSGVEGLSPKAKKRYLCEENLKTLETVKRLSEKYGCSVAAVISGAFTSDTRVKTFPIIGCSNPVQLEDSLSGADIVLTQDEVNEVFAAVIG